MNRTLATSVVLPSMFTPFSVGVLWAAGMVLSNAALVLIAARAAQRQSLDSAKDWRASDRDTVARVADRTLRRTNACAIVCILYFAFAFLITIPDVRDSCQHLQIVNGWTAFLLAESLPYIVFLILVKFDRLRTAVLLGMVCGVFATLMALLNIIPVTDVTPTAPGALLFAFLPVALVCGLGFVGGSAKIYSALPRRPFDSTKIFATFVVVLALFLQIFIVSTLRGPIYPRQARGSDSRAIANLRTIATAQVTFYASRSKYGNIDELIESELIDSRFKQAVSGFQFSVALSNDDYKATATPVGCGAQNAYYTTADAVIRYLNDIPARNMEAGSPVQ